MIEESSSNSFNAENISQSDNSNILLHNPHPNNTQGNQQHHIQGNQPNHAQGNQLDQITELLTNLVNQQNQMMVLLNNIANQQNLILEKINNHH